MNNSISSITFQCFCILIWTSNIRQ